MTSTEQDKAAIAEIERELRPDCELFRLVVRAAMDAAHDNPLGSRSFTVASLRRAARDHFKPDVLRALEARSAPSYLAHTITDDLVKKQRVKGVVDATVVRGEAELLSEHAGSRAATYGLVTAAEAAQRAKDAAEAAAANSTLRGSVVYLTSALRSSLGYDLPDGVVSYDTREDGKHVAVFAFTARDLDEVADAIHDSTDQ